MRAVLGASAIALLVSACLIESPTTGELGDEPGVAAAPIIGGLPDDGHLNVVMVQTRTGLCTGTLVGRSLVLTAAHCIDANILDGDTGQGTVLFGSGFDDPDAVTRRIVDMTMHRYYKAEQLGVGLPYDIGFVRLGSDAPEQIEPMAVNLDPLSQSLVGQTVRAVGFGANNGAAQTGFGTKRTVLLPINSIGPLHLGVGDDQKNTCQGDSGGPGILSIDSVQTVVGVVSTGPTGCVGNSHFTRVDAYRDDFVIEVLDAWGDGACKHDGSCTAEGCRTADPDCDVCGFDGLCASGCTRVDLDCPLAGLGGELCDTGDDCESRVCVDALDDPRVRYCSQACDPSVVINDTCSPPLSVCDAGGASETHCHYSGPTPSAQGSDCNEGGDCRSNVCDFDNGICVEQCGDGLAECADGFACESFGGGVSACTIPRGGGCAVDGGSGRGGAALALTALVGLVIVRRRRRR